MTDEFFLVKADARVGRVVMQSLRDIVEE